MENSVVTFNQYKITEVRNANNHTHVVMPYKFEHISSILKRVLDNIGTEFEMTDKQQVVTKSK